MYDICDYWYFSGKDFKFQPNIFNAFHNLLMMSLNLNDSAILNISSVEYWCIINRISKDDAINIL